MGSCAWAYMILSALPCAGWILFASRGIRMFAFGGVGVILVSSGTCCGHLLLLRGLTPPDADAAYTQALYLHALGLSDDRIGFLLFLTLIGDAIISLLVSVFCQFPGAPIPHANHAHAAARWQRRSSRAAN